MRLAKGSQKTTPFHLLKSTIKKHDGARFKTYESDSILRYCNFSTYGGTERNIDGLLSIEDTAEVVTWYSPDIKASDRIRLLETGAEYDIISEPENIERRGIECKFKVRRVKGGA